MHKGTHYQKTKAKKNEKTGMEGPQGQKEMTDVIKEEEKMEFRSERTSDTKTAGVQR